MITHDLIKETIDELIDLFNNRKFSELEGRCSREIVSSSLYGNKDTIEDVVTLSDFLQTHPISLATKVINRTIATTVLKNDGTEIVTAICLYVCIQNSSLHECGWKKFSLVLKPVNDKLEVTNVAYSPG